ncbi:glucosaminidase domain-containing protein [Cohnella soli]|uniref:Glucosaminidase domain-containing protein n=1 Tax=Cohnella soli TaxID=425005 RepID=A0ABW0HXN0_9BACL
MRSQSFRSSLFYGLVLALFVNLGVRAHPADMATSAYAAPRTVQPLPSIAIISSPQDVPALSEREAVAPAASSSNVAQSADIPKNAKEEVRLSSVAASPTLSPSPQSQMQSQSRSQSPSHRTYVVTAFYLNVRASANSSSEVLKVVKKGTKLEVDVEKSNEWLALKEGGFVHGGYAEPISPMESAQPAMPMQQGAVAGAAQALVNSADSETAQARDDAPNRPTSKVESDSGLSEADIETIFEGTALAGHGLEQTVLEVEEKYGINALFTIAVMKLESGNGRSKLAKKKNNLFGLNAITGDAHNKAYAFETKGDSVRKFGQLLSASYVDKGYTTIEKIAGKYCPANSKWPGLVKSIMKKDFQKISDA